MSGKVNPRALPVVPARVSEPGWASPPEQAFDRGRNRSPRTFMNTRGPLSGTPHGWMEGCSLNSLTRANHAPETETPQLKTTTVHKDIGPVRAKRSAPSSSPRQAVKKRPTAPLRGAGGSGGVPVAMPPDVAFPGRGPQGRLRLCIEGFFTPCRRHRSPGSHPKVRPNSMTYPARQVR